jgi:hypothetical protein
MFGRDPISISESLALETVRPAEGKVWVICRDLGPEIEASHRTTFFHGYHGKRIVFSSLWGHSKGFNDIRILGVYARFISENLNLKPLSLTVLQRDATPSELREEMPRWRQHRESTADQAAASFAAAIRRMRVGYANT